MIPLGPAWEIGLGLVVPAAAILWLGPRLTRYADHLGDWSRIGKTLIGALLLGATTSLPGITTSFVAAVRDQPSLAAANAVGGIAVQTAFLAVADVFYRRANLEHDAGSIANLVQSCLLLVVLVIPIAASLSPLAAGWAVHPATALLVVVYLAGLRLVKRSGERPMWYPVSPEGGRRERRGPAAPRIPSLIPRILASAAVVAGAGWLLTLGAERMIERYALTAAAAGALGTAVVTSLPELVTTVAAVRRGALSLAVGGIMGGNAFDVLFLAVADLGYLEGSIYHHAEQAVWFQLAVACGMVAVLLLGLTMRQRRGPANIGFESLAVLVIYLLSAVVLALWPS